MRCLVGRIEGMEERRLGNRSSVRRDLASGGSSFDGIPDAYSCLCHAVSCWYPE